MFPNLSKLRIHSCVPVGAMLRNAKFEPSDDKNDIRKAQWPTTEICSICLEGNLSKDREAPDNWGYAGEYHLIQLCASMHVFHKKCAERWLKDKEMEDRSCPECKLKVLDSVHAELRLPDYDAIRLAEQQRQQRREQEREAQEREAFLAREREREAREREEMARQQEEMAWKRLLSGYDRGVWNGVELRPTPPIKFVNYQQLNGNTRHGPLENDNEVIEWYLWFKGHHDVETQDLWTIRNNFETYARHFWFLPNRSGDDAAFSFTWNRRLLIIDKKYTTDEGLQAQRFHFCLYLPPDKARQFITWIDEQLPALDSGASAFWKRFLGLSQALTTNAGSRPVNRGAFTATTTQEEGRTVWAPLPAHSEGLSITSEQERTWQAFRLEIMPKPPDYHDAVLRAEQFNNYNSPNNPEEQNPMDFAIGWNFYLKGSLQNKHEQFRNYVREWFSDFMQTWHNDQLLPKESIKQRLVISHYEYETMQRIGAKRQRREGQILANGEVLAPVVRCEFLFYIPRCHALAFKIMLDATSSTIGLGEAMYNVLGIDGAKKFMFDKDKHSRIFSISDAATYIKTFPERSKTDSPKDDLASYKKWPASNTIAQIVSNGNNNNTPQPEHPRAPPPIFDDPNFGPVQMDVVDTNKTN